MNAKVEKLVPQAVRDNQITIILFVILLVLTAILAPVFFNIQNILNVARQASVTGVVAVGMTFVILTGGIDLSVGSILAVVGVCFAMMIKQNVPIPLAMIISMLIGVVIGLCNGIGITFFGIQAFIMTLATMAIGEGVALLLSDGTPVSCMVDSNILNLIGNGNVAGIPGPLIIFAVSALISGVVLRYLTFGRFVYGIGGSLEAARLSGVKTTRILLIVYAISGLCAAIAGLITTARLFVGHPTAGGFIMLDSIAAVVIGGTSLMGGRGSIAGTVAGVLLLAMVANLLNLLGVSPFHQEIVKGAIIIVAVLFTAPGLKQRILQQWADL
ncbi:MAG: ABC transporter permease [Verrucomicrobia bacterium]|nr:ABC transporter permease [Verrucomicrobiota bacterium]